MSHEKQLQLMMVADLAQRCAQETDHYLNHRHSDSRYCFELFKRAILERDDSAWTALIHQYKSLVAKWVRKWASKQSDFSPVNEEEDFIAEAFERFWKHFTPEKLSKSQSLDAVLQYLKLCVSGTMLDFARKTYYERFDQQLEGTDEDHAFDPPEEELTPEELLQKEDFWQLIRKKCKDEKEYIVIYASFCLALTPREILAEYPAKFPSIKEIYQHKANMLERLGRDGDIMEFAR
jgi:RNA polymerase sigma factor (sigma-70 family)